MTRLVGRDPVSGRALRVDIEGRIIAAVTEVDDHPDRWIAPGLIDLQVNGFAGHDVNAADVDVDTVRGLVNALRAIGVTTVVPTLVTASEHRLNAALATIAAARAQDPGIAHAIPFVHLEGPFLSDQDGPRGVHDAASIRPPDIEEVRRWQQAGEGLVGMLTLSPHRPGSPEFIRQVTALGVQVAVGHTHATADQVRAAADAGATLSTHLGNGAHAVLARHPNYIWAQLADDRLRASLIADGHHLPADTFTVMLRALGPHRAHLVSDATALAGSPPGRYTTPVGGEVELSADGRLSHAGTPYLAGAARSLTDGVAIATRLAGIGLGEALRLATGNPARQLSGAASERGVLRPGAAADLITFDFTPGEDTLRVRQVVVAGIEHPGGRE